VIRRIRFALAAAAALSVAICAGQGAKGPVGPTKARPLFVKMPFTKLDLAGDPAIARRCDPQSALHVEWLDDARQLVSYGVPPCKGAAVGYAVVGLDGRVGAATDTRQLGVSSLAAGPAGLVVSTGEHEIGILDDGFKTLRTIPCDGCTAYLARDRQGMALCSGAKHDACRYFLGAETAPGAAQDFPEGFPALDAARGVKQQMVRVSQSESWYFDSRSHLFSVTGAVATPVPVPSLLAINETCSGEATAEVPRRFLVSCTGGIGLGQEGVSYNYPRLTLFDVATRRVLATWDADGVPVRLSPDGKHVAVAMASKNAEIRLRSIP